MAVKEYRHRYRVFEIDSPRAIERWELIKEFQRMASRMGLDQSDEIRPWLTAFKDNRGILRCTHHDREKAMELLKGITEVGEERLKVSIKTVTTSGTIRKAKESM